MLITEVCKKDGCNGNTFNVNTNENKLITKCTVCGEEQVYEEELNYLVAPTCSKCDSEIFKVYKNNENTQKYLNCVKCNSIPRIIYVDNEGKQVSYEELRLSEIEETLEEVVDDLNDLKILSDYIYSDVSDLKTAVDNLKEY